MTTPPPESEPQTPSEVGHDPHDPRDYSENEPLNHYDELDPAQIAAKAEALEEPGVAGLLEYEREHADRDEVTQLLERRLDALKQAGGPAGS